MWIRLKTIQHIDKQGRNITYHPGDWVDVGKQTALLWMSRGDAEIPSFKRDTLISGEMGVVIKADKIELYQPQFDLAKLELRFMSGEPCIAFTRTLCWTPKVLLRPELIGPGFGFLDSWEIAMPIYSYVELATHIGTDEGKARTKAIVRDLRIPLYDTRLIFVRNCEGTRRLFEQWDKERESGDDDRLTFMRAFYKVQPLMLALPATWHSPQLYSGVA